MAAVAEQLFQRMAAHMLKQGARSYDEDRDICMYRGPGGCKCPVGELIDDDYYIPELETKSVLKRPVQNALRLSGIEVTPETLEVMRDCQHVHDQMDPACWREDLEEVAAEHGLTLNVGNEDGGTDGGRDIAAGGADRVVDPGETSA